mmetsp:Transcript_29111/g.56281  ORF Transcript_29111/g.56281 Transcript_29111/m.56281 type:complete len:121 (+) Transcript_29111:98-460(+)
MQPLQSLSTPLQKARAPAAAEPDSDIVPAVPRPPIATLCRLAKKDPPVTPAMLLCHNAASEPPVMPAPVKPAIAKAAGAANTLPTAPTAMAARHFFGTVNDVAELAEAQQNTQSSVSLAM